jgi:hypothetical protein
VGQNAKTAQSSYEAWNQRDFDTFSKLLEKGEIVMMGTGDKLVGSPGARQFAEMWANGFPDGKVQIDNVCESPEMTCIEYTGRGTHTGTLATPMGSFEATGKTVDLKLCDCWSFASDGTPKQVRTYFDSASLMAQLGLMPQMAGATA